MERRVPAAVEEWFQIKSGFRPTTFPEQFDCLYALDEHFAHLWLWHSARLLSGRHLDMRTRILVLVTQYTWTKSPGELADTLGVGLKNDVDPKEMLEVILQSFIYLGESRVAAAASVFTDVMSEAGVLEDVKRRSLPYQDATAQGRSLEEERKLWDPADAADPRLEDLLSRHDWKGLSTGLRLRPGHILNRTYMLDAVDPEFCDLYLGLSWDGLYARGVLDDKTRLLCIAGGCLAVGEPQSRTFLKGALANGATPKQLMELVYQTVGIFGHPHTMLRTDDVIAIVDAAGRLDELIDDKERIDEVRRLASAELRKRSL
jgi:alkylhydroperoxidase/carboxymuconolactone decarboxylase family protein YurZ